MEQLTQALLIEKKKKQQGKQLNLLGEKDNKPQIFTPTKIQVALASCDKAMAEQNSSLTDSVTLT